MATNQTGNPDYVLNAAIVLGLVDKDNVFQKVSDLEQKLKDMGLAAEKGMTFFYPKTFKGGGGLGARNDKDQELWRIGPNQGAKAVKDALINQFSQNAATDLGKLNEKIKEQTISWKTYRAGLLQIRQTYGLTSDALKSMGALHEHTLGNMIGDMAILARRAMFVIPIWMLLRNGYMAVIQGTKEFIKQSIELEAILAEIQMVGNSTASVYKLLAKEVMALGSMYGYSAKEALEAAKIFVQQGLSISETLEMTKTSMLAAQVLGTTVAESAENLTSAVRAYNIPFRDSIMIVDKWMKVQKDYAVTAKDLAEGMKTAGATAQAFGISLDAFNGHLVGIIETTRKSGSQAANALQMIYTRLFSTGKDSIAQIAKVKVYQDELGQSTYENTGIFREAEAVLYDISKAWKTLSESEKIELATQIGSRRQATPFIALMDSYERSLSAQVASLASAGDAWDSFKIKQNTASFKVKELSATWTNLAAALGDTTGIKAAIDAVNQLGEAILVLSNYTEYYSKHLLQARDIQINTLQAEKARAVSVKGLTDIRTKAVEQGDMPLVTQIDEALNKLKPKVTRTVEEIQLELDKVNLDSATEQLDIRLKAKRKELAVIQKNPQTRMFYNIVDSQREVRLAQEVKDLEEERANIQKEMGPEGRAAAANLLKIKEMDDTRIENAEKSKAALRQEIDFQTDLYRLKGATDTEALRYKIAQIEAAERLTLIEKDQVVYQQLKNDLIKAEFAEIKAEADKLRGAFEGGLQDWILGKGDISNIGIKFGDAIKEGMASSLAGGLTDTIFNTTGLDTMFGGMFVGIKNAIRGSNIQSQIETAHKVVYELIVRGHRDGAIVAAGGSVSGTASYSGGGGMGAIFGQSNGFWGQPLIGSTGGGTEIIGMGEQGYMYGPAKGKSTITRGQLAVAGMGGIVTGYSMYQSAKAGGMGTGGAVASGIFGAAGGIAGGIAGGLAAGPAGGVLLGMGPIGWAMLGVGLMVAALLPSLFGKKSTQKSSETRTSEGTVTSKIDVTNKNLEIINRNLMALRTDIRAYILPSSAYFSEKRNIEDEFSIMSRRGFQG